MSRLHSLIYLLPELWRTLFTRPITVRFPCGQCQDVCRQGAIRLMSEYMPAAPDHDALRERFGEYSPAPKTTPAQRPAW